jgi:NhaA family Na+:H+ antiporter
MTTQRKLPSEVLDQTRNRFNRFFKAEASSSIILLITTITALIWANSYAQTYFATWNTIIAIRVGEFGLSKPVSCWVNDGLMAFFFLVIGLEIKREFMVGELSNRNEAVLPFTAAIGGMMVPAILYLLLNQGTSVIKGWGVPMATDIAFSLGILSLLGAQVPLCLKVFLTATAIVDDLGAILIIALFYTDELKFIPLLVAGLIMLTLIMANRRGISRPSMYMVLGVALWLAILKSGLHATLAGILLAITIPARTRLDPQAFITDSLTILESFQQSAPPDDKRFLNKQCTNAISNLEENCAKVEPLIQRWERELHNIVAYAIVPIFALVNAGVNLGDAGIQALTSNVSLGIILGLAMGKPLGIFLFSWLAVKLNLARLPAKMTFKHILGAGCLAGIGFTMSIFVSSLAFSDLRIITYAKVGIIIGSIVSGVAGISILKAADDSPTKFPIR